MKHHQIKNIIEKKASKINLLCAEVNGHFKGEDIHSFRVEVKKLRAFMRLIGLGPNNESVLPFPKKIHKFYNAIGVIRSFQIQQKHVQKAFDNEYSVRPEIYMDLLSTRIANDIKLAKESAKKKNPFKKEMQQVVSLSPCELETATINTFIRLKINTFEKLLKPLFLCDASIHSIRKLLKDLLYTWPYINHELAVMAPNSIFSGKEDIVSITGLLGDFQDICVCLHLLHAKYMDKVINKKEDLLLKDMEKKWLQEKEITRKEIYEMFQRKMSLQERCPFYPESPQLKLADKLAFSVA